MNLVHAAILSLALGLVLEGKMTLIRAAILSLALALTTCAAQAALSPASVLRDVSSGKERNEQGA